MTDPGGAGGPLPPAPPVARTPTTDTEDPLMALNYPEDLAVLGEHWAEAIKHPEAKATRYAQAAEAQIAALPPTITDLTVANPSYVLAVALQASELAKASVRDGGVIIGPDGQHVRPRPVLDAVRALVRPRRVSRKVG